MFQRLSFKCMFVIVLASCIAARDGVEANDIVIRNSLKSNKNLRVHCKSKDNDIGSRVVGPFRSYEFSFKDNIFGTTLFWCNLWQGPNYKHHQGFVAYKGKFLKRRDRLNFWEAREDGIYFTTNVDAKAEFKYGWDVPHK